MTRRLGAWDCEYCGTKRILGDVFDCPGCGKSRSRGVRFYTISDGPVVTPKIAKVLGTGGPNWYCEYCDSGNKDNSVKCWNCGAPRGSSPSHKVTTYKQGEVPHSTEEAEAADLDGRSWVETSAGSDGQPAGQQHGPRVLPSPQRLWYRYPSTSTSYGRSRVWEFLPNGLDQLKPYVIGACLLLGVVVLSLLAYQFFFNTHEELVRVSGFNWAQSVTVQEYQAVHETSWTTYPNTAYDVKSDYRDTGRDEKVHDGWKTVSYQDTCYETVSYQDTCTQSVYNSRTCTGQRDNGDGSFSTYTYECGSYSTESYSCTKTRQEPYSCTKTRQEELYHYKDIYDWYYQYTINKWITIANYPTSGSDHEPYYYTNFDLSNPYSGSGTPQLGQQQKSQVPGKYTVTFFCEGNTKVGEKGYFSREYSLGEWEMFGYESSYPIEVNAFNKILTYPTP